MGQRMQLEITELPVVGLEPHPLSATIFGQLPPDQFANLVNDLDVFGLRYPLEVDVFGRVICGSQRLRAIKQLGWEKAATIQRNDLNDENAIREWLIKDNTLRRQLSPRQMYNASRELERIYGVRAREREVAGLKRGNVLPPKIETNERGQTRDLVAKQLGTSGSTLERLKKVYESDDETLKAKVDQGLVSISAAERQVSKSRMQAVTISDNRTIPLKLARWQTRIEDHIRWMKSNPPSEYGHLAPKMRPLLDRLIEISNIQLGVLDGSVE
jgi:hypothetical protein